MIFQNLSPNFTLQSLKSSLFPGASVPQESIFFTLNGKPLYDATPLFPKSRITYFSTLTANFRLCGGGGDGGATEAESRDCYLNMYAVKKSDKRVQIPVVRGVDRAVKFCISCSPSLGKWRDATLACNVILRDLPSWEKIGFGGATVDVIDEFIASYQIITSNFLFVLQITENKKVSYQISSYILQLIQQGIGLNMTGISNHTHRRCKIKFSGSPSERAFLSQAALESDMDGKKLINDCGIVEVKTLENLSWSSFVMPLLHLILHIVE